MQSMTTTPHKEQGWEERFDELYEGKETLQSGYDSAFWVEGRLVNGDPKTEHKVRIKLLIQQEIDAAYEHAATEVEGMMKNVDCDYEPHKNNLGEWHRPFCPATMGSHENITNAALSQAAEKLRSLKKI